MKIAVLPFSTAEGTKPAYGRQFAQFAAEQLRTSANADMNSVNLMTQIEQNGVARAAFANLGDALLPYEQLRDLFTQAEVDYVQDGTLREEDGVFHWTLRFHEKDNAVPVFEESASFPKAELFDRLQWVIATQAKFARVELPETLQPGKMPYGTQNPDVFLAFLEGFDALNYVGQSQGAVVEEFNPQVPIDALLDASKEDPEFTGVFQLLIQFCRTCLQFGVGNFEMINEALTKASAMQPDDFAPYFALGELHQAANQLEKASNFYEKAIQKQPEDSGLYNRLGVVQMQLRMPVNAERNFRRAMELEGEDQTSADFLAGVLQEQGRDHEIPAIWKAIVEQYPQKGDAHAKYAVSLIRNGKKEEGVKVFEAALESLEDNAIIKRYYAPYLVEENDLDRAMDFYEDVLDVAPNDIPTLLEYAQTLEKADRAFEVPRVLKDVLQSNPDPNTRAEVLARLIELEQPKRAESVESARVKVDQGDFAGAIRDLKPLRNWLADYWKLWALLSSAYNRTEQYQEAEDASVRLIELFPGCEPAYGEYVTALVNQGRAEEAYNNMQRVASANPSSLQVHLTLGLAMQAAGKHTEARQLAKAIRDAVGQNDDLEPILAEIEK
ncbi:MAG: tetratricopeptide repeat protein [Fimbriimonadaceae bacterium]|nr:tetratricopeptide repeat protein [Fimbriimonadaceae bacterium]